MSVVGQAASANVAWSLELADHLAAGQSWSRDVWSSLLSAWRAATLDVDACARVVQLLESHRSIGDYSPGAVASLIEHMIDRKDLPVADMERLEHIAERVLLASDSEPAGVHHGDGSIDWLTSAINHPAGQVALARLKALGRRMAIAAEGWHGLPDSVRARFEALITGGGHNAELARVVFASQAHFLFRADRAWTDTHVIPLFNWDTDPVRAAQAWDGFLVWGRWDEALFGRMERFVRGTLRRIRDLDDRERAFASALAAVAAFLPTDPWRNDGWLAEFIQTVDAEHRAQWASEFGRYIETLNPEAADALWNRWLENYWNARITGVPRPLDELERRSMVSWVSSLGPMVGAGVDLVLASPPETLDHHTFYQLSHSGIAESHGMETGRLLRGLLATLTAISYDTGEVAELATEAFRHGAQVSDLLSAADDMMRLGCSGSEQLRNLLLSGSAG